MAFGEIITARVARGTFIRYHLAGFTRGNLKERRLIGATHLRAAIKLSPHYEERRARSRIARLCVISRGTLISDMYRSTNFARIKFHARARARASMHEN